MELDVFPGRVIAFDLDDTLYPEKAFMESGFNAVLSYLGRHGDAQLLNQMWNWWHSGARVFDKLARSLGGSIDELVLLDVYRFHEPHIALNHGAADLLLDIKAAGGRTGIVTDGRSRTQRAKIAALGLEPLIDAVVISEDIGSEKPNARNFRAIEEVLGTRCPVYFADNPRKDFVGPNALGWMSVMVMDGYANIHSQDIDVPPNARATQTVASLKSVSVVAAAGPGQSPPSQ